MWKKIIGYTLAALVTVAAAAFAFLYFRKPASQPPARLSVAMTPERIARGKYIYTLADCDGCHSRHDQTKLYLPVTANGQAVGQVMEEDGLPGRIVPSNLTTDRETGIGAWTDGEKMRAIREGIGRDGRALFPMMPYQLFRNMSDEDVQSLVAYLNTLKPVHNPLPATQVAFPVSLLIRSEPKPVTASISTPPRTNQIAYGEYLATLGVCEGCHTPFDKGSFVWSKRLAGGRTFSFKGFRVVSANLTPDRDSGIGNWNVDYFLERFTRHRNVPVEALPQVNKEQWTLMPWRNLSQLSNEDLSAIYAYLKSLPPTFNKIVTHPVQTASN